MLDRRFPHGMRIAAPFALLLTLLFLLAGCGGGDASPTNADGPDPATAVPANAAVYAEAVLRPSGEMEDGALAAARKVLRVEDPAAELHRLIDRGLAESSVPGPPTYARDIDPWLGDRAGVFVLPDRSAARDGDPVAGLVVAVRDRDALEQELMRLRDAGELRAGGSEGGVDYDVTDGDEPVGIVSGDLLVFASSRDALRAAVAAADGDSLADASRYTDAVDAVPEDALAFAYADLRALLPALSQGDVPAAPRKALGSLAKSPIVASLTANADEIAIEASGESDLTKTESSDAEVSVGQLPGDAWLALATPPIGPLVRSALDSAGVHDEAAAQVRAKLGLDLDRDLLDPLGGLGLFARGESPLDLGGGVLLQLTDAAAAQRLLRRVQTIVAAGANLPVRPAAAGGARGFQVGIPQSPQPIVVLAQGDKLAAGYAASSAEDLLDPQQRFDESSAGKAAIDTLGDGYEPALVVIVPPLAALLRALDQLEVAELSPVIPYVKAYRSLAIGTKRDGDRTTVRIVAALR